VAWPWEWVAELMARAMGELREMRRRGSSASAGGAGAAGAEGQGLTLVHFSAQPEPFPTQNTPLPPSVTP